AQLQQRRFVSALATLATFGDAVETDPRLRDWRGMAQVSVGRTEEGLADLEAAAKAWPDIPEFQFNLGAVLHRLGRDEEALPHLQRAVELRPNFAAAVKLR